MGCTGNQYLFTYEGVAVDTNMPAPVYQIPVLDLFYCSCFSNDAPAILRLSYRDHQGMRVTLHDTPITHNDIYYLSSAGKLESKNFVVKHLKKTTSLNTDLINLDMAVMHPGGYMAFQMSNVCATYDFNIFENVHCMIFRWGATTLCNIVGNTYLLGRNIPSVRGGIGIFEISIASVSLD